MNIFTVFKINSAIFIFFWSFIFFKSFSFCLFSSSSFGFSFLGVYAYFLFEGASSSLLYSLDASIFKSSFGFFTLLSLKESSSLYVPSEYSASSSPLSSSITDLLFNSFCLKKFYFLEWYCSYLLFLLTSSFFMYSESIVLAFV